MESRGKYRYVSVVLVLMATALSQGCARGIVHHNADVRRNAIPAHRVPLELTVPPKQHMVPVEWTRLRRPPVREHVIGPHDVLGVFVEEVLPTETARPIVYRASEDTVSPSVGQPIRVRTDGSIFLPLVGPLNVTGMTLPQATDAVRQQYLAKEILTEERLVTVELIQARTVKIFVVRDDARLDTIGAIGVNQARITTPLELPVFENDVLHALSASGGLPSEDGFNEVWVLRGATVSDSRRDELLSDLSRHLSDDDSVAAPSEFIRIPLTVCPGQEFPFSSQDVILEDGDVVFIEAREEFFLTGGLIEGGRFQLPRDEDIDILEAIAMAGNNAFGPVGRGVGNNFRGGPGAIIPPTRVTVIRKLETGEQVRIAVDIRAALNDPNERLLIGNRDLIILQYRPHEIMGNLALNILGLNVFFNDATFRVN